ncbi:MAG: carbon-nitrogen family hydrolase, partial [Dialister sp.]|nr:carbon-nitrogen family hydrolase [Dialister sp.]MDY6116298.1 nitrilase-related carbon-nitrogen hydrolase [Dialister sp.]
MKEKISLIQMDVELGQVERNYEKAVQLMELALEDKPDILVLPETLNTGFFPSPDSALYAASDADGAQTKKVFGAFAKEHGVNIVAGSVSVLENGCVFNRSYIFDRKGEVVASYDKIHGFSPMGETKSYTGGSSTVHFTLDGIACSMAICYDVRFCELIRTEALQGVDLFFLPAAWPLVRKEHWITLSKARA